MPLPFTSYEAERQLSHQATTWTGGQTVELLAHANVRPRLVAAVSWRRFHERQNSVSVNWIDGSIAGGTTTEWHRRAWLFSMGGGLNASLVGRVFLTGDLDWVFWNLERCSDCADRFIRTDGLTGARSITLRAGIGFSL